MSVQKQMIRYMNIARQLPSYYIALIQKQLASFINDKQMPLTEDVIYQTNEGKHAWLQALSFLKHQKPLNPFQDHQGLNMSSRDHALDLAKSGVFGHVGSDGSTFSQRILKHCRKGQGSMAELIGADFHFQNRNHPEMTVLGLIIDDGVTDRGHRKTIFNPVYQFIGCKSQLQGEKVVTVFNITEKNLALRTPSTLESTGGSFGQKASQSQNFSSTKKSPQKAQDRFASSGFSLKPSSQRSPFSDISNPLKSNSSNGQFNSTGNSQKTSLKDRKICEKKQSSKIYYEQNSKITEITTKLVYNDGTIEQKVDRHTVYLQQ